MAVYLIANKDTSELETTIFASAGGDAVAVFTDPKTAQAYIDEANWQETMTVATLDAIAFMEWLILCHRDGVKLMVTDPRRSDQEANLKITTLDIEAQLEHAGQHLARVANRDF